MGTYNYTGTITKVSVTQSGIYQIAAYGAQGGAGGHSPAVSRGGSGGLGAEMVGDFHLTQGEVLEIVVGGQGKAGYFGGGGGGGSFVLAGNGSGSYTLLEAAGGGGGGGFASSPGYYHDGGSAKITTDGSVYSSLVGAGGQNGGGGGVAHWGGGSGGAGVKGDGASTGSFSKPHSYGGSNGSGGYKGGAGGFQNGISGGDGGFGGGGGGGYGLVTPNYSGGGEFGGGGGGGYSGGGGGEAFYGGAGGGSFDAGANAVKSAGMQFGNGLVIIESVCFLQGSRVLTADGEVAVEDLRPGISIVTASGATRQIKWLGHRGIDCRRHARPSEILPVRISAHAFGENRPARDLYLSPGHAVCVDVLGEVLIPVSALINGASIAQVGAHEVVYWHVELESHDILIAENLPCESYLDCGNRGFFIESGTPTLRARPDVVLDAAARAKLPFCRPFHESGPVVEAARAQLARRAEALGWSLTPSALAGLHLVVDGRTIEGEANGLVARFALPPEAGDVWLVAETVRPYDLGAGPDKRDLGVALRRLSVDGCEIALADPRLRVGFHEAEDGWRWIGRRARLPASLIGARGGRALIVELAGPALPRWCREPELPKPHSTRRSCGSSAHQ